MGYIAAGFILFSLAIAIVALYELLPQHLRNNIDNLIDDISRFEGR